MTSNKKTYAELKEELDGVLQKLQQEDIGVDDALVAYERGMELIKQLETTLNDAENKIIKLKAKFE